MAPPPEEQALAAAEGEVPPAAAKESALALAASEPQSQVTEGGPTTYIVTQGVVFLKRSSRPESGKIVRVRKPVGVVLHTTGRQWRGDRGGLWVELLPDGDGGGNGLTGWTLVSGPGFGIEGPALIHLKDKTAAGLMTISVRWLKDPPIFECVLPTVATVDDLAKALAKQTGLNVREIIFTTGLPGKSMKGEQLPVDYTPPKDVLTSDMVLGELKIKDSLNLVYLGHFDEDFIPGSGTDTGIAARG
uniref:Uncharacterized protein n=1 Tax=Zooxanthella nutricula TaxID=1333877 RepID=A0A7S2KUY1_9DINO